MLDDITAFVTGASGGIGEEIAVTFAEYGANVALASRSEEGLAKTADRIGDETRTLEVRTDVTDEESVADAVAATAEAFGGLDCLVNNAGVAGPVLPFDRISPEEFADTLDVNVVGAFTCAKYAADHLRESDRGSVVNISSIGGKRPYPNRIPYATSKMGLNGLTRTLAYELGRDDVTVNTVLPGPVEGPRIEEVIEKQAELADVDGAHPFTTGPDDFALNDFLTSPREIAEQVAYLAGPNARHITAEEISIDGGGTWY